MVRRHYIISLDFSDSFCGGNITDNTLHFTSNTTNTTTRFNCKWHIERNYSFYLHIVRFNNFGDSNLLCWSSNEPISGKEKKEGCWTSRIKPSPVYYIKRKLQLTFLSGGHKSAALFDIRLRSEKRKCFYILKIL